jgi:hypothetical protein
MSVKMYEDINCENCGEPVEEGLPNLNYPHEDVELCRAPPEGFPSTVFKTERRIDLSVLYIKTYENP